MLHDLFRWLAAFGINLKTVRSSFRGLRFFRRDHREIRRQLKSNADFTITRLYPVLRERFETNGDLKSHYFHEDLLVARRIFENNPAKHVDVGSRVDGLVAHVASFRALEVFDIRPQKTIIHNIKFVTADFMQIPDSLHNYTDSLSSLNVVEHFGLGRYGDPVDVNGHIKGLDNMHKVLKPGGRFYFSTPIGPQRIEFNAHRVFSVLYLLNYFRPKYKVERFSYVDDGGDLHENAALTTQAISTNFGCQFGFGIFELVKL